MITLQLIDVPFDADVANPQGRPLGTPEQLAARFGELLPGTQFDAEGRGVFRRGTYEIAFKFYGNPPTSIGVAFEQPEALAAIARVVEKTHWCLIDPELKTFIDIAASRAAGRAVPLGGEGATPPDEPIGPDQAANTPRGATAATSGFTATGLAVMKVRRSLPPRTRMMIAALTGLVIASVGVWYANKLTDGALAARLPTSLLAAQQDPNRLERYEDRVRRRATLEKAVAPRFRGNKVVQQMLDMQMADRAYWNFVDGKFSSPELLSNDNIWSRYKMPTWLPVVFRQRQRDGYEFEFRGAGCEITEPNWPECAAYAYFARPINKESNEPVFALFSSDDKVRFTSDGSTPSRDDPAVTTR